ncbi:MAG: molybdopterin cofactor-binding domain-containing protein [Desulforhopalus sp.]
MTTITRRTFIQKSSLVIAASALHGNLELFNASPVQAGAASSFKPHAFVEVGGDDSITVWLGQTNLGQGTHTGIPMIIAEELEADWETVRPQMALAGEPFKDPHWHMQTTGGSTSIRHRWDMIRKAGAAAREMLVQAAADGWGIDPTLCKAVKGKVVHPEGQAISYGKLVTGAAKLPVPENPALKDPKDYTIIGSARDRFDIPDKVAGKTKYGIDMVLPNMCIAVVARPPRYGAVPEKYDEGAAMAVTGVLKVVPLKDKVAICADTTYGAMQGREKLGIQWSTGSSPDLNSHTLETIFADQLAQPGAVAEDKGNSKKALADAEIILEGSYAFPYIAHCALEPINCTAHVEKDRCRIWVPTQGQTTAQNVAAKITGLPVEKIELMTTPAGGGFGLRSMPDPVIDAVLLSQKMGRPVKVMWTREDDFTNDYCRPGSVSQVKAGLDKNGQVVAWSQKVASPSIMSKIMPSYVQNGIDTTSIQGIPDMAYDLTNRRIEYVLMDLPIPIGFWRSVGYTMNTFMVETFIDELAHAAKKDPVDFRLGMMRKDSRPHRTLSLLAEKTNWGDPAPQGRARGVAVGSCFGSSAAHMAEVSVDTTRGKINLHKLVCAIDCGPAVFPDAIVAQMEGGAVMALSAAFHERMEFADGGPASLNFDEYRLLTISEVPEVEVHIANSKDKIGGVGEPGVPTVAPAVANAVFAATGIKFRELPFKTELLKQG